MPQFKAKIEVRFKDGVLDPQGEAIKNALINLGNSGVHAVGTGKLFWVDLNADSPQEAQRIAAVLADQLLANPVIENYGVEILK